MKKTAPSPVLLAGALMLASCTHNPNDGVKNPVETTGLPVSANIHSEESGLSPERFLGYGFNLVAHHRDDQDGMSRVSVLDMERINNRMPWNPWNTSVDPTKMPRPKIIVSTETPRPHYPDMGENQDSYNFEDVNIGSDGIFQKVSFDIDYNKTTEYNVKSHIRRSFCYDINHKVALKGLPKVYSYYISELFYYDLTALPAEDLVQEYGTHLVTSYDLGAFTNLVFYANASVFSSNEGTEIACSLLGAELDSEIARKAKENRDALSVRYSQGGSDYFPENLVWSPEKFEFGVTKGVDPKEWYAKKRPGDDPFISLSTSAGLISIPDLIPDPYLKLKYACGILHATNPGKKIQYVICDPDTFEPIKLSNGFIYFTNTSFSSVDVNIYYGNKMMYFSPSTLGQGSSTSSVWSVQILPDGRATLRHRTGSYLTKNLTLLKANQPTEECYFVLNPIVPQKGDGSDLYAWDNIMFKK